MPSVLVSTIVNRASVLLQDTANIRWPQSELVDWLNAGQRELVVYKPNACVQNTDVALVAGTKQALPPDGNVLVDITRNTGGPAIRIINRQLLDTQIPNWHDPRTASATTKHYCYSEVNPKNFYVYPPSPGGNSVEMIYHATPAAAQAGGTINVDDIYEGALLDYVLYRAYSKDAEYDANGGAAGAHYQAFLTALKGKEGGEAESDPNHAR